MIGDEAELSGVPKQVDSGRTPSRRRGRPKGSRPDTELRGTVVKKYTLTRDEERTAGHIRRIVMQREVPDTAVVSFDDACITIEWTSE